MVRKNDTKKVDFTIEKVEKGPSYHIIHHIFLPQLPHSLQLKFEAVKNSKKLCANLQFEIFHGLCNFENDHKWQTSRVWREREFLKQSHATHNLSQGKSEKHSLVGLVRMEGKQANFYMKQSSSNFFFTLQLAEVDEISKENFCTVLRLLIQKFPTHNWNQSRGNMLIVFGACAMRTEWKIFRINVDSLQWPFNSSLPKPAACSCDLRKQLQLQLQLKKSLNTQKKNRWIKLIYDIFNAMRESAEISELNGMLLNKDLWSLLNFTHNNFPQLQLLSLSPLLSIHRRMNVKRMEKRNGRGNHEAYNFFNYFPLQLLKILHLSVMFHSISTMQ